jgi:hypothetical protein
VHCGDAGEEGLAAGCIEDSVGRCHHFVGQLLGEVPLGTLSVGDLGDVVF